MNGELYRAEQLPVFQNRMFRTAAEAMACARGDVVLVRDPRTGFVFNSAFRPELMQYDADYQNEQAVSSVFRAHLDEITQIVDRHFRGRSLIEVGCGKGYFLEHLQGLGFEVTGIDPAYEGDNPRVVKARFSRDAGLGAEGLVLRHVLEHIQRPAAFLAELREANGGGGTIFIEVPCLDWICRHRAWFDVFYEHVNYFRLDDFRRMFGRIHEAFGVSRGLCRFHRALCRKDERARHPGRGLGRRIERRDLLPLHAARGGADRLRRRHQSRQARPLSAGDRPSRLLTRGNAGADPGGLGHLRDERQLLAGNTADDAG